MRPDVSDYLMSLGDCEPLGARGEVEPAEGCASGACAGMTYPEINEVLAEEGTCATASGNSERVYCTWQVGIDGYFVDADKDTLPDSGAKTSRIHVFAPYTGALSQGAGIESTPACYVQELGEPDWVVLEDVEGVLVARELKWSSVGLDLYDRGNDDGSGVPEGDIDEMYLYGAP